MPHELRAEHGCTSECFGIREAEVIYEMLQIAGVAAIGVERETVVAADEYPYATTFEFGDQLGFELHPLRCTGLHVAHVDVRRRCCLERGDRNARTRRVEDLVLLRGHRVYRRVVGEGA